MQETLRNASPTQNLLSKTKTPKHNGKTLQPKTKQGDGCHALNLVFAIHFLEINARITKTKTITTTKTTTKTKTKTKTTTKTKTITTTKTTTKTKTKTKTTTKKAMWVQLVGNPKEQWVVAGASGKEQQTIGH